MRRKLLLIIGFLVFTLTSCTPFSYKLYDGDVLVNSQQSCQELKKVKDEVTPPNKDGYIFIGYEDKEGNNLNDSICQNIKGNEIYLLYDQENYKVTIYDRYDYEMFVVDITPGSDLSVLQNGDYGDIYYSRLLANTIDFTKVIELSEEYYTNLVHTVDITIKDFDGNLIEVRTVEYMSYYSELQGDYPTLYEEANRNTEVHGEVTDDITVYYTETELNLSIGLVVYSDQEPFMKELITRFTTLCSLNGIDFYYRVAEYNQKANEITDLVDNEDVGLLVVVVDESTEVFPLLVAAGDTEVVFVTQQYLDGLSDYSEEFVDHLLVVNPLPEVYDLLDKVKADFDDGTIIDTNSNGVLDIVLVTDGSYYNGSQDTAIGYAVFYMLNNFTNYELKDAYHSFYQTNGSAYEYAYSLHTDTTLDFDVVVTLNWADTLSFNSGMVDAGYDYQLYGITIPDINRYDLDTSGIDYYLDEDYYNKAFFVVQASMNVINDRDIDYGTFLVVDEYGTIYYSTRDTVE